MIQLDIVFGAPVRYIQSMAEEIKRLFTVNEACTYLSISRMSLYRMMERKEIAPVKIGNRTLFDKRDLDEFIEKAKK
ncbi:MAG: Helix-turn-helix domain protein [Deltaproteobacteria bacterium ADurb.Bin135]|jgi:excisionase family DNA binding protein|nr:MAG: Helix-turn-helix domain protein [Deltaproteobacteria bacterium ADurb.Bin135]